MELHKKNDLYDKSIVIDQKDYPKNLNYELRHLEDASKNGDWATYFTLAENLDVTLKNCYAAGEITKKTWNRFNEKYWDYTGGEIDYDDH